MNDYETSENESTTNKRNGTHKPKTIKDNYTDVQMTSKEDIIYKPKIKVGHIKNRVYTIQNKGLQTKPRKIMNSQMNRKTFILYDNIIDNSR